MPSDLGRKYLADIAENIRLAREFLGTLDAEAFFADKRTYYAVVRCLEIISEASRRLEPDVVSRHPRIPWHQIRSSGNLYRHEYGDVDYEIVHVTVTDDLPILLAVVEAELAASRP